MILRVGLFAESKRHKAIDRDLAFRLYLAKSIELVIKRSTQFITASLPFAQRPHQSLLIGFQNLGQNIIPE